MFAISSFVGNHTILPIKVSASFIEAPIETPVELSIQAITPVYCSCVVEIRKKVPSLPRGDAKDLETNSPFPILHGVMKLSYRKADEQNILLYHLVYVEEINERGMWVWGNCLHQTDEPYREFIEYGDERIQGYWNPNA